MQPESHPSGDRWGDSYDEPRTAAGVRPRNGPRRKWLALACLCFSFSAVLLTVGWVLGRSSKGALSSCVVPGEFERHDALMLAWPTDRIFPADLQPPQQDIVATIVDAVRDNIDIVVLVPDNRNEMAAAERLCPEGVNDGRIRFLRAPNALAWVRDYGPLVRKSFDGSFQVVDTIYQHEEFPGQDDVPQAVSKALNLPLLQAPILAQYGNLLSNGAGLCVTTDKLIQENVGLGYNESRMTKLLREYFGATQVVYMESLDGEMTGHVDMFMTFTAPDAVVVGQYSRSYDRKNAAILDRNAERLAQLRTTSGPLRVHRVPMPERVADNWFTYTNVVFANGVLLLPTYGVGNRETELQARTIFSNLLPGWEIVGIDCSQLIFGKGALHCVAMNLFKLPKPEKAAGG